MRNNIGTKILCFLVAAFCFGYGQPIAFATEGGSKPDTSVRTGAGGDVAGRTSFKPKPAGGSSRYGLDGAWMKSLSPPEPLRPVTGSDFVDLSSFNWGSKQKALYRVTREMAEMVEESARARAKGRLKKRIADAVASRSQTVAFLRTRHENMKVMHVAYAPMLFDDVRENGTLFERVLNALIYDDDIDTGMVDRVIEGRVGRYQKLSIDTLRSALGIPANPLETVSTALSNAKQRLIAAYKGENK